MYFCSSYTRTATHLPPDSLYNEQDLLLQIAEGDETAFASLFRQYSSRVYGFVLKIIPQSDLAGEIVNDIFLRLWLTRESLAEIRNLETYLFVISRNHALNVVKKSLREKKNLENWYREATTVDDSLTHGALDLIDEALLHLSEQQRRCWMLSRRKGKSYQEIEEELNISHNTVKTHIRMANASIKQYVLKRIDMSVVLLMAFSKYF